MCRGRRRVRPLDVHFRLAYAAVISLRMLHFRLLALGLKRAAIRHAATFAG